MYDVSIDDAKKVVRVHMRGTFTEPEAHAYNAALAQAVREALRRFGLIKVLADTREAGVQTASVVALFRTPTEVMGENTGRYAVICGSMLAKLQAKRVLEDERAQAFMSDTAAELWLHAIDEGQRSPA